MRSQSISLIVVLILAASTAESDGIERLIVRAQAAIVEIDPIPAGRQLVSLPILEFVLELEPHCAAPASAESISISVADTRKTEQVSDSAADTSIEMTLKIPPRQTGLFAIDTFCVQGESPHSGPQTLLVRDAFTAQLALRCTSDDTRSIIYAVQPLDISFRCRATKQSEAPSPDDQDSSSSAKRLKTKNPSVRVQASSAVSAT